MSNCFELFGVDFLVDEDTLAVSLLEVNPGPDFKQTGQRLKVVIESLFEDTVKVSMDQLVRECTSPPASVGEFDRMTLVYDKEWSTSKLQGGMKFK